MTAAAATKKIASTPVRAERDQHVSILPVVQDAISEKIIFCLELRHTSIQHLSYTWAIKLTVIQTSGISVIG